VRPARELNWAPPFHSSSAHITRKGSAGNNSYPLPHLSIELLHDKETISPSVSLIPHTHIDPVRQYAAAHSLNNRNHYFLTTT
jgi:hypothetical protein